MSFDVREYGQIKANPEEKGSFVKLQGKGTYGTDPGEDTVTTSGFSGAVSGIVFEGQTITLENAVTVNSDAAAEDLKDEIVKAIETNGVAEEFQVFVEVTNASGDDFTVRHIGQGTLSAVGGQSTSRLTTIIQAANYTAQVVDTVGALSFNGSSGAALANDPYAYTGTQGTDDTTAGQLKTDLEAALTAQGVPYKSVTVAVNNTAGAFDVTIKAKKSQRLSLGGAALGESVGSHQVFI